MNINKFVLTLLIGAGLTACSYDRNPESGNYNPEDPGFVYEFEGDMYYSVPYDPLSQWEGHFNRFNKDSINMRMPVKGTIARGKRGYTYRYENTMDGYELAGKELHNPLENTPENIAAGKYLYDINCWHCHGKEGRADGPVAKKVTPPLYQAKNIRELSEGKMFHSITYGKNLMGSHASQLNPNERWQVILYVKKLMHTGPFPDQPASDSTKTKQADKKDLKDTKESKKS
ncbi:MAG: cytochrome c [Bacteroidetes bacterium]|nr:cytochrome c [Bacteroidota bacterium]